MSNKLMIVAHPDDESIFGGAELLKDNNWKVVCITEGNNEQRSKEFRKAMDLLNIRDYEIWHYKAEYADFDREALTKDLQRVLFEREYNKIVTHNLEGEYGHIQHKTVSRILHGLVKKNLYVFANPNSALNEEDILPFALLKRKICLLWEAYPSQIVSLENLRRFILSEKIRKVY